MLQKGLFKLFCKSLVLSLFTIALPAKAVVYSIFGNIEFVANGSNIIAPAGEAIFNAINNQYAGFTVDIDTTIDDTNPATNAIELRNAVNSTAIISGITLTLANNPCLNLDIDCRVTSSKEIFGTNTDTQLIASQLHNTSALGVTGSLSFFVNTSGQDLFTIPRQKIADPFAGSTNVNFSVFYIDNGLQRVNFKLANISATPVPEPSSSLMFGAAILIGLLRLKKLKTV